MSNGYISVVKLPNNNTYDIKDASAWSAIEALWLQVGAGLQLVIKSSYSDLGTASADTMGKIYLVPDTHDQNPSAGGTDAYDEYVTIDKGSGTPRYVWEKIGNTDVNLTDYSHKNHTHTVDINIGVNSHSYTPAGTLSTPTFTGTEFNSTGSYTPAGTISLSNTNKTALVSPTLGDATYTPAGEVDRPEFTGIEDVIKLSGYGNATGTVTLNAVPDHTHSMGRTRKYLHPVKVPTAFGTTDVVKGLTTGHLATTSIRGVKGTGTTHDTPTLNTTQYGSASGWSAGTASSWAFSVSSETLTISGSNSTAPALTINNVSVGTSLTAGAQRTYALIADASTTVATGDLSTAGGATIVTGAESTAAAYTSISASTNSFTSDSTSSGGTVYVTDTSTTTGDGGAHTPTGSITINQIDVSVKGAYTPQGSVSKPSFTGTGVRLATGNIQVPTSASFSGTQATITVSGTPTGTVSKPSFTGTAATLSHTVTGNGTKTTSAASN